MPRPDLSPRALALGDKLLARLDLHTPRTMDDLLPWWERQGVLRVELVRLLRQLVEDGQVNRGPDGFQRADPDNAPPPEPVRPAPPAIQAPAVRSTSSVPANQAAARDSGKLPAAAARPTSKTPTPARVEPAPAKAAPPAARPASAPAKESPKSSPKEPVAKEAKAPAKPAAAGPKSSPKEPVAKAARPAKDDAPSKRAKEDSDPPPSRGEPDAGSLVGRVLNELRREPQTCAVMITKFPGTNGNTVRGALARLKASGLARLDDEGIYHPST